MSYDIWFFRYGVQQTNFFISMDNFFALLPLLPPTTQKIKILKTSKKTPVDIIILDTCTKNHDHMLYCSLDMSCNGCNIFHFGAFFAPFPH